MSCDPVKVIPLLQAFLWFFIFVIRRAVPLYLQSFLSSLSKVEDVYLPHLHIASL